MIGQVVLGKYKVTRLLDRGGMSNIFIARQLDVERDVVVKVLQAQFLTRPKTREHFRREIYIASRFQHPGAVAYIDSSLKEKSGPVLVMEYVRGVELHELLNREKKLPAERVGRILAALCDVLQSAHDAGIVHRDVKPGNVMVVNVGTPQESAKLMDFGLAKMSSGLYISPEDLVDFTLPAAAGTPEYISPEMVRGHEVDGRADLYSVGVMLFEMLTGRLPFTHVDAQALMQAHANDEPPSFVDVGFRGPAPAGIEPVVRSCLSKTPDGRPRSAMDLAQRYEQALGRRLNLVRRGPTPPGGTSASTLPMRQMAPPRSRSGVEHSVEVNMVEALAMVKLRGFVYDLGGEVVESVPGVIKVRVPDAPAQKNNGMFGWLSTPKTQTVPSGTEIELHMERRDPAKPSQLTITLVIKPSRGLITVEWHRRCKKLGMDLQAYLMGSVPGGVVYPAPK
jgi:serine/threonine-protein kinase